MPLINVKVIEGVFDADQKREIVKKLTEAMVSIEGENMRPVTWCVVEEVRSGDWGMGGQHPHHRRRVEPGGRPTCGGVAPRQRSAAPPGKYGAALGPARQGAPRQAMTLNIERKSSIERKRDR